MYQIHLIGGPAGRAKVGTREDKIDASLYAAEFEGTVEVVNEKTGLLVGVAQDGEWTDAAQLGARQRREIL